MFQIYFSYSRVLTLEASRKIPRIERGAGFNVLYVCFLGSPILGEWATFSGGSAMLAGVCVLFRFDWALGRDIVNLVSIHYGLARHAEYLTKPDRRHCNMFGAGFLRPARLLN